MTRYFVLLYCLQCSNSTCIAQWTGAGCGTRRVNACPIRAFLSRFFNMMEDDCTAMRLASQRRGEAGLNSAAEELRHGGMDRFPAPGESCCPAPVACHRPVTIGIAVTVIGRFRIRGGVSALRPGRCHRSVTIGLAVAVTDCLPSRALRAACRTCPWRACRHRRRHRHRHRR